MRFPTMWYVRSAKPQISLHMSLCYSLEYSLCVKLLTEYHLECIILYRDYTGSYETTLVKMQNCWKSQVAANMPFVKMP